MPEYNPAVDGRPEPGEVVWAWVPYSPGSRDGKERPVVVLHVDGARLTVVAMTSRTDDRRARGVWVELEAGSWDRQGRRSAVRVDQPLVVSVYDARRVRAFLDDDDFDEVLAAARRYR